MTIKRTLTQADADFLQKQFSEVFATKKDLEPFITKKDLIDLEKRSNNNLDQKLDDQEQKFEKTVTNFKDKFYTKIDPILKEVVASREDRLIGSEQHIRNEQRIEKLEKIHSKGKHVATI